MEKLQELVEVKMELDDDLPYRAALVPQVEDLGLERFVLVDVGHWYGRLFLSRISIRHSSNGVVSSKIFPELFFILFDIIRHSDV